MALTEEAAAAFRQCPQAKEFEADDLFNVEPNAKESVLYASTHRIKTYAKLMRGIRILRLAA
eukprot:12932124-Prorocentrum_lima.AAC.1